jgi:hypothetical protein
MAATTTPHRTFQDLQTRKRRQGRLTGYVNIGNTGAVGTIKCVGVQSVTRNSAGNYTIVLDKIYADMIPDVWVAVTSQNMTTSITTLTLSSSTIVVQCQIANTGTATDPSNGAKLCLDIPYSDSGDFGTN